ncbi:MAG TPA: hypothetical protein VFU56_00720 [Gaiellaceae bacterium]|nr:hypothetical protein [Gaiellaceae bacterium]
MPKRLLPLLVIAVSALVTGVGHASTPPVLDCGQARLQTQNGNQLFVSGGGPACLYRAFAARCRAASFAVTLHGVDTAGSVRFRVVPAPSCHVVVFGRNHVFGADRTTTWSERCARLGKRTEGIAVVGCRGRIGDFLLSPPAAPNVPGTRY